MTKDDKSTKVTRRSQKSGSTPIFDAFRYTDEQRRRIIDLLNSVCPESGLPFRLPVDTEDRPAREALALAFEDPNIPVGTTGDLFFAPIAFWANEAVKTFDPAGECAKDRRERLAAMGRLTRELEQTVNDLSVFPVFRLPELGGSSDQSDREKLSSILESLRRLASAERGPPKLPMAAMDRNGIVDFLVMRTLEVHDALSGKAGAFSGSNPQDSLIDLVESVAEPVLDHLGLDPADWMHRIRKLRKDLRAEAG